LQRRAIESVPPLLVIRKELGETGAYENYGEIIELLYWVLLRLRDPYIKSVQKECVSIYILCAYLNLLSLHQGAISEILKIKRTLQYDTKS